VNSFIEDNGFGGQIDLLSLDMDGIDCWIWRAMDCVQPRVVVLEYNNRWGAEASVTIPYSADFRHSHSGYFGASLRAFVRLGEEKGYRLVGCNRPNTNAFFVRVGIAEDILPTVAISTCLTSPFARHQHGHQLPKVRELEWVEV